MASPRRIIESRAGQLIVVTAAAIAAGTAIPLYATGTFDTPPPACYVASPTAGATLAAAATLTATCGGSTTFASFAVDGAIVASTFTAPFSASWNSSAVANGSHNVTAIACDTNSTCVTSSAVAVTVSNAVAAPTNTVAPAASGSAIVGQTLSCTTGTWTGDVSSGYTYQWKDAGGNITGATSATYVIAVGENTATIQCTVTATGTGGSTAADSNSIGPVTNAGGGALLANEWLSPTGSDSGSACAHSGLVAAPVAANACATPQKACNLASGGDVIGVMAGQYPVGFILSSCAPASTITYTIPTGTFAAFAPHGNITNSSNITLQGDQVGHGVGFSLSQMAVSGSGGTTNNVTWNNINLYCQNTSPWIVLTSGLTSEVACDASVYISGAVSNFTWNGGDDSDWATCFTNCTHTGLTGSPTHNTIDPGPTNITIEHTTISHYFSLDNNGSAGDHSEAWMLRGGSGILFLDNKFTACAPPVSTGYARNNSCNSSYVFFGQSGSANTTANVTFTQNIIDPGFSGLTGFQYAYNVPAGGEYSLTLLYNSFVGGSTICGISIVKCGPGTGTTVTGSNITMAGNILLMGGNTCFSSATYSHNVFFFPTATASNCGASHVTLSNTPWTSIWTNPRDPTYDDSLLAGTSAALGAGENTYCPATDINGTARPTLTPCDAGAVQH